MPGYNAIVLATLLGTGGAWPIPRPGCSCAQCAEARAEPRERRTRSGLYLETAAGNVLLDACPDVIAQLEREQLSPAIRAVIISHHHADHVFGLSDLCYVLREVEPPIPVYAGAATQALIRAAFPYLLRPERPKIRLEPWTSGMRLTFGEVALEGFETLHREESETVGVLIRTRSRGRESRIVYATDMGAAEPTPRSLLEGVDLFVGDGTYLGEAGYGHPGTERMIAIARGFGARRIAVTHVGHWGLSSAEAADHVPRDVAICRDGDALFPFPDRQ